MYLKKDLLLNTNVYDIVFYWIVHLKKNILYLKRCGYVFSILVVDKTYVINLLGLLIPSWIWFIYIVHGYWHSVESNFLISSLSSWLKYYLRQIYISYKYICYQENNVPSWLSSQWLFGNSLYSNFICLLYECHKI